METVFAAQTGSMIGTAPATVWAPDITFVSRSRLEAVCRSRLLARSTGPRGGSHISVRRLF